MFRPTRYIQWARRFYGQVPYDLATSGMPTITRAELGMPETKLDDPRGWELLRGMVAAYNDVPADEVTPALGTTQALWLAYATVLSPGDEVLVEEPGYEPLLRTAEGVGARITRFPRRWRLEPGAVKAALTPKTRMVVLSTLHNPSGDRAGDDELREVARLAESRGAYLLVDEVYAPFDTLGDVFRASARRLDGNVIAVGSLTKCFGVGLERIGWMLAPRDITERAEDSVIGSVGLLPLSWAHLSAHTFSRLPFLAARAKRLLGTKREKVARFVESRPELTWSEPEAGLFGFVESSRAGDLTTVIEEGARREGVLVGAGSFFGVPNGFRISWSIDESKLDEALTRLGRVLPGA